VRLAPAKNASKGLERTRTRDVFEVRDQSPSARSARLPILVLALDGFCVANYLAAFQRGRMNTGWHPIFRQRSSPARHSFLSRLFPVPDAILGGAGYLAAMVRDWRRRALADITLVGARLRSDRRFNRHHGDWPGDYASLCPSGDRLLCLCSVAIAFGIAWLARNAVRASPGVLRETQPDMTARL